VDLHRHLEGSLRLETLAEIARRYPMDIPGTGELAVLVQVSENEPYTFQNFLAKFETLRQFYRTPEIIVRLTREAINDAAADNVRYLELRFNPIALSRQQGFPLPDVVCWVLEGVRRAQADHDITTRLIASFNRHEPVELAEQVTQLAVDHQADGILGLDVAGNEAEFPIQPFASLLQEAKKAGLHLSVHAGEWGGPANIAEAILILRADRIGHGVRILEDPQLVELARQAGIPFEVCLTSNFQSGVVPSLSAHPLPRMLAAGLNVTLNTDDPSISQITLSHEYQLACEQLAMPQQTLKESILAAAQASFLPTAERQSLFTSLSAQLENLFPPQPAG
jgi:adenosine deaminase